MTRGYLLTKSLRAQTYSETLSGFSTVVQCVITHGKCEDTQSPEKAGSRAEVEAGDEAQGTH